jgi:pSer/pThr/pTyr-binding forkhead associated (FHA) protein
MSSNYRLVMRSGPSIGQIYPLEKSEMVIGRDLGNEIVISDSEVSRRHARIFMQGNNYVIEDLGSTNGTFVNAQRLTGSYVLRPGEIITFGETLSLVFEGTVDTDATVVSGSSFSIPEAAPQQQRPAAQPVQQAAPSYSGQIPDAVSAPAKPKKKIPTVLIIILVLLILMCLCSIAFIWYIDANSMWCQVFPFLFPDACPQL